MRTSSRVPITRIVWLASVVGASLLAGCGEGRAIFDVDVYSFLSGAGQAQVPYVAPSPFDTIPVQAVNLLPTGLGASVVESVTVSGAVTFDNQAGTGTVGLKLYIDTVPKLYSDTPAVSVTPVSVANVQSVPAPFKADVPAILHQLFLSTKVYVGMRAIATGTARGTARLTALRVRVVVQDKIFH
jgi:hypothetical protein